MHSTLVRAQNVFGFFTTVCFVVAGLIALSDFSWERKPSSTVSVKDVQVVRGRPHYYSTKKEEYAHIRFNLNTDLSSLFTWNTKQVFVYVSATWPSNSTGPRDNEAVIWDTIITSPSADHLQNIGPAAMKKLVKSAKGKSIDPSRGKLNLKNQKAKYQITSPTGKLAETDDVVLKVHYNVQPWVGMLTWTPQVDFGGWKTMKGGVSKAFTLPALKKKKEEPKKATS
ncbi:microsomal signal peptidase subunit (Gp23)-like protein [Coleophoma crateriformis]|uniref:Signal peptidase subunit 3 n=1 Tax=Coleophoma crateriformis TaxID=565419 RepID=A0A3D8RWS5_9HELO|nr:microsomal signal peptidase subunit (Gp23)-like protein [Coleophoma crateriformis]